MLNPRFVPNNELHVFRDGVWRFSVAKLCLKGEETPHPEPLAHQFCLRAPGLDQVAFDVRDVRPMDPLAAWDPHLRVGQLTRLLGKCFHAADDIIDAIAPYMCPLDASVRFAMPPQPDDRTAAP